MKDRYGVEIVAGTLVVCEEHTGSVPGRVWLGIAVRDNEWPSGLVFQSANLEVVMHEDQSHYWQVVLPPKGYKVIKDDGLSK